MPSEAAFSSVIRKDFDTIYGESGKAILLVDAPRSKKKDCDVLFYKYLEDGNVEALAVELKYEKGKSINFERVSLNQVISLKQFESTNVKTWILTWFYKYKVAIALNIFAWLYIKENFEKEGRKSIKFEELMWVIENFENDKNYCMCGQILKRKKINKKTRWEVEKLFKD